MFMGLGSELRVVDHLTHSCCDTGELRGLAQWNLPSFIICGMRSGGYNPEVTNGETCRFLSRNPNYVDETSLKKKKKNWELDITGLLGKLCSILNTV